MWGLARSAWSASLMSSSFSSIILTSARSCAARHSAGRVRPAAKLARSSRATSSAIPPPPFPPGNVDKCSRASKKQRRDATRWCWWW
uniref:Secreted protein n=1 Tax=Arundo donax TaxID=35708 RepID=A0A0A9G547_ARUDO